MVWLPSQDGRVEMVGMRTSEVRSDRPDSRTGAGAGGARAHLAGGLIAIAALVIAGGPAVAESGSPSPTATTTVAVLPPLPAPATPPPGGQALAAALSALDSPSLGGSVGAVVVDGVTGAVLFDRQAAVARMPASTTKVLTGTAVTTALGAQTRLATRAVSDGDTVLIVGAGDPQLRKTRSDEHPGDASLAELAEQTAKALRARAEGAVPSSSSPASGIASTASSAVASPTASAPMTVSVAIDDSLFTGPATAPSWSSEYLSTCIVRPIQALSINPGVVPEEVPCDPEADPALAAGRTFAELLAAEGVTVTGEVTRRKAGPAAVELAAVASPPVADLVEQTSLRSDNTAAEMLAHLAGGATAGEASFAGGAAATGAVLQRLGVPTAGLALSDASGLSRDNRIPPSVIAATLVKVAANDNPDLWPVGTGLPVAGFDGTLANRFASPETSEGRGQVRAKTGTLTGVGALGGWVVDRQGRLLIFDFVSDRTEDSEAARSSLDQAAAALAACGCTGPAN